MGAAKLEQSLRDGLEQDIAERLLVHQDERVEFVWQSEHEMEVAQAIKEAGAIEALPLAE